MGITKTLLALIILPFALAACQTAEQQKQQAQSRVALNALKTLAAEKAAPVEVMISEFEKRCRAVVGKEFDSIEQAATAAGLKTPGIFIPKIRNFKARTLFASPDEPSIAFIMPKLKTNGCTMIATTDQPIPATEAIIAAYEARKNGKKIELPGFGRFGAGTVFDLLDEEVTVVVSKRKRRKSAINMQMFNGNLNLDLKKSEQPI